MFVKKVQFFTMFFTCELLQCKFLVRTASSTDNVNVERVN